jgi:hypothetical protein
MNFESKPHSNYVHPCEFCIKLYSNYIIAFGIVQPRGNGAKSSKNVVGNVSFFRLVILHPSRFAIIISEAANERKACDSAENKCG